MQSKVLAKFQVNRTSREPRHEVPEGGGQSVVVGHAVVVSLSAVQDDLFGPHTPHGEISMTIHNEAAGKIFEDRVGQEFMLEFVPADEFIGVGAPSGASEATGDGIEEAAPGEAVGAED